MTSHETLVDVFSTDPAFVSPVIQSLLQQLGNPNRALYQFFNEEPNLSWKQSLFNYLKPIMDLYATNNFDNRRVQLPFTNSQTYYIFQLVDNNYTIESEKQLIDAPTNGQIILYNTVLLLFTQELTLLQFQWIKEMVQLLEKEFSKAATQNIDTSKLQLLYNDIQEQIKNVTDTQWSVEKFKAIQSQELYFETKYRVDLLDKLLDLLMTKNKLRDPINEILQHATPFNTGDVFAQLKRLLQNNVITSIHVNNFPNVRLTLPSPVLLLDNNCTPTSVPYTRDNAPYNLPYYFDTLENCEDTKRTIRNDPLTSLPITESAIFLLKKHLIQNKFFVSNEAMSSLRDYFEPRNMMPRSSYDSLTRFYPPILQNHLEEYLASMSLLTKVALCVYVLNLKAETCYFEWYGDESQSTHISFFLIILLDENEISFFSLFPKLPPASYLVRQSAWEVQLEEVLLSRITKKSWFDDNMSLWVNNRPYVLLKESETRIIRYYMKSPEVAIVSQPIPLVFKQSIVFRESDGYQDYMLYRNGRHHFLVLDRDEFVGNFSVQRPVYVNRDLVPVVYQFKAMYSLICTGFRTDEIMKFFENPSSITCTHYGSKIAKSLIRIASTRIFAEPEQSILELPVNSFDSYSTKSTIGKFGMGFFSILYWLVGYPQRFLVIKSYFKNQGVNYMFKCVVRESEVTQELEFQLTFKPCNVTLTGVYIKLDTKHARSSFSQQNVYLFEEQLTKLQFTNSALLVLNRVPTVSKRNYRKYNQADVNHPNVVYVAFDRNGICVEDFAQGITLDVLLKKLFVPSVSTKTLKTSLSSENEEEYRAQKQTGVEVKETPTSSENSFFIILVRAVAVVSLKFKSEKKSTVRIIIDLPGSTRIPVSRDDITLTRKTKPLLLQELNEVYNRFLQMESIYCFQLALNKYISYTPNTENKLFFENYLRSVENVPGKILVKHNVFQVLKQLDARNLFLEATESALVPLENYMSTQHGETNIYFQKKVRILPNVHRFTGKYAISAELCNFLFVDEKFTQTTRNWVIALPHSYLQDQLVPYVNYRSIERINDEYMAYIIDSFQQKIQGASTQEREDIVNLASQITLKLIRLCQRYNVAGTVTNAYGSNISLDTEKDFIRFIILDLLVLCNLSLERGILYLYRFNSYLDDLLLQRFSNVYGSDEKPHLKLRTGSLDFRTGQVVNVSEWKNKPKQVKYIFDWAFATLQVKFPTFPCILQWTFKNPLYLFNIVEVTQIRVGRESDPSALRKRFVDVLQSRLNLPVIEFVIWCMLFNSLLLHDLTDEVADNLVLIFQTETRQNLLFQKIREFVTKTISDLNLFFKTYCTQDIRFIVGKQVNVKEVVSGLVDEVQKRFKIAMELYLSQFIQNEFVLPFDESALPAFTPENRYTFTESELIHYVITHDVDNRTLFRDVAATATANDVQVQITEIAINEGSTKSFVNAVLTETMQNSIDAIRIFNPPRESRKIEVYLKQTDTHLVYQISDFVGIEFDGVVSLMIPFLSSKTASEIVTGEMGSGFFNLYRESDLVLVHTVKNGLQTLIKDVPIRDTNDRVVDITRTVQTTAVAGVSNQTNIYVFIPKSAELDFQKTNFVYFIKFVFGLLNFQDIGFDLFYNNQRVFIETREVWRTEQFAMRFVKGGSVNSFLFTKGVPFLPLSDYLQSLNFEMSKFIKETLEVNFVLDIQHGVYTPVQTRAKINLSDQAAASLEFFLLDVVYLHSLKVMLASTDEEVNAKYLENLLSQASLDQLCPHHFHARRQQFYGTLQSFMLLYTYPNTDLSFEYLFYRSLQIMGRTPFSELTAAQRAELSSITKGNREMEVMLFRWLEPKNQFFTDSFAKIKSKLEETKAPGEEKEDETDDQRLRSLIKIKAILQHFLNVFWQTGRLEREVSDTDPTKKAIKGFQKHMVGPQLKFYRLKGVKGQYVPNEHVIEMNSALFSNLDMEQFITFFQQDTDTLDWLEMRNNVVYQNTLQAEYKASTLIHELEHARRSDTGHSGMHGVTIDILPGDTAREYTFDEGAGVVFSTIWNTPSFLNNFLTTARRLALS